MKRRQQSQGLGNDSERNYLMADLAAHFEEISPFLKQPDSALIGTLIRYRDTDTNNINTCTVLDYGKSHVHGEFFSVVYELGDAGKVSKTLSVKEMELILSSQVDDR